MERDRQSRRSVLEHADAAAVRPDKHEHADRMADMAGNDRYIHAVTVEPYTDGEADTDIIAIPDSDEFAMTTGKPADISSDGSAIQSDAVRRSV